MFLLTDKKSLVRIQKNAYNLSFLHVNFPSSKQKKKTQNQRPDNNNFGLAKTYKQTIYWCYKNEICLKIINFFFCQPFKIQTKYFSGKKINLILIFFSVVVFMTRIP